MFLNHECLFYFQILNLIAGLLQALHISLDHFAEFNYYQYQCDVLNAFII